MTLIEYWLLSGLLSMLYVAFEYEAIIKPFNHKQIQKSLFISEQKYKITLKIFILIFGFVIGFILFPFIVFCELIKLISN